jgi:3'(2'), 5'-bisphosphate nucleotidase
MQIIVEEAGGVFKQLDGSEMKYNRKNSLNDKGFLVLNKESNNLLKRI